MPFLYFVRVMRLVTKHITNASIGTKIKKTTTTTTAILRRNWISFEGVIEKRIPSIYGLLNTIANPMI